MTRNFHFIATVMYFVITKFSVLVAGDYILEVRVTSYSNPTNKCAAFSDSGGCCDGNTGPCTGSDRCDTYFRFCLRPFGTNSISRGCTSTIVTSSIALNDAPIDFSQPTFLGLDNPLLLAGLGTTWEGAQLYVEAVDRDSGTDDLIDTFPVDIGREISIGSTYTNSSTVSGIFGFSMIGLTGRVLCTENYFGDRCQFLNLSCLTDNITCSSRGICVDETFNYTCNCNPGYTGRDCELIDNCFGVTCSGNGQCVDGVGNFTCLCQPGFTGNLCNVAVVQLNGLIAGGVLGAVVVLALIIFIIVTTSALILRRKAGRQIEVSIQDSPSNMNIEMSSNVGYGINERGAAATEDDHNYDYIEPTIITGRGSSSGQIQDQEFDMKVNVVYGIDHDSN